jgi:hypothetical protein
VRPPEPRCGAPPREARMVGCCATSRWAFLYFRGGDPPSPRPPERLCSGDFVLLAWSFRRFVRGATPDPLVVSARVRPVTNRGSATASLWCTPHGPVSPRAASEPSVSRATPSPSAVRPVSPAARQVSR